MDDDDITEYLTRRSRECRAKAEKAKTPAERDRWIELAEYLTDLAKRWTMP